MRVRKEKKQRTEKRQFGVKYREIIGILLSAFAVFSILALYVDTAGWVGLTLRRVLGAAFGDLAVVFAAILVLVSVQVFRGKRWPPTLRILLGLLLLLFAVFLSYHMLYYRGYQFPPQLAEELGYARRGEGGGVLGALLLVFSYNAFGIQGSYVLVGTAALLGVILFFQISLVDLGRALAGKIKDACLAWWGKRRERSEQRKLRRLEKKQAHRAERARQKELAQAESRPAPEKKLSEPKQMKKEKPKAKEDAAPEPKVEQAPDPTPSPNTAKAGQYQLPPLYLLQKNRGRARRPETERADLLEETLAHFGIEAKVVNVSQGPVVTRYELQPAPGIKVSRITALADDIALAFAAEDVRIEAPVPGKPVVGIEVPNKRTESVLLRDVMESPAFSEHESPVALALGKDIAGEPVIADLQKWLHILMAGATGSGKSVGLKAMISSLLFRADPEQVKLLMIDPKRVELSVFDGIPHLISPVVTDPRKAANALRWAVVEMERRYQLFAETGARNLEMYMQSLADEPEREPLPYIVVIIDELADLMMVAAAEVEDAICRLAQMARAAGVYLIIATQRPSVDVITGLIKANVPSRISYAVSSQVDSRTILDMGGAERLIGKGDMLYYPIGAAKPTRAQGAWISDKEVEALVSWWKKQGEPEYEEVMDEVLNGSAFEEDEYEDDELLPDAIRLVVENGQASISMLQRRFRIGYSRAARLIDVMEVRGIVGSYQGSKPREVLVDSTIFEEG